jgi:RNA polymerase sigma-70 factor (ECF subfamily)
MMTPSAAADADRGSDSTSAFEGQRGRLFGLAYRMLGTIADAEDLVQETFVRWHTADPTQIRSPEAWLVAVITRLAIDRLRRVASERSLYVGSWLPEPLPLDSLPNAEHRLERASDLSVAFLVVLEQLSPEERAALLLREVFERDYSEIAGVLAKSEAACRQLVHRARDHVQARRRPSAPDSAHYAELLARLVSAIEAGDQASLLRLLAPDVTFVSDGGGKAIAARNVLAGAERIARFLLNVQRKLSGGMTYRVATVNGEPTLLAFRGSVLVATTSIAASESQIHTFYRVLNPDKLRHLGACLANTQRPGHAPACISEPSPSRAG